MFHDFHLLQAVHSLKSRLDKFKEKDKYHWNFRCPICGDSDKNPNKCRGNIFEGEDTLFFKCFNCSAGYSLQYFLKLHFPDIFTEYQMKKAEERNENKPKVSETILPKPVFAVKDVALPNVKNLESDHITHIYLSLRKIPIDRYSEFYFAENYHDYVNSIRNDGKYSKLPQDERLVAPIKNIEGKIIGCQGRSLDPRNKLRYVTCKFDDNGQLAWNIDKVDKTKPILVFEGIFDALFFDNAIAMVGAQNAEIEKLENTVFILDNEPRSVEIVKKINALIEKGKTICLFADKKFESFKDINEFIINSISQSEILEYIEKNSVRGLEAKMKLLLWKKI